MNARGEALTRIACAVDAPKTGLRVEAYEPPAQVKQDVERIMQAAGIDVGGVESVIDDRDGRRLYYDINALSNFVADPEKMIGFNPYARLADYLIEEARRNEARTKAGQLTQAGAHAMRYGYWLPVFGGWLRNVEDENMQASWAYVKRLAQRSEELGFDLTLIAELNLNDIKGVDAPSLDAWSTAAALAAVTEKIELMVAVRPTFHLPALLAKQAANIDRISGGRLSLNVVSSWWADEARKYGVTFEQHDDRYARTSEWLDVVDGAWSKDHFSYTGKYYRVEDNVLQPKPLAKPRPTIYAGGESPAAKDLIAEKADAYLMHGDLPERAAEKVQDLSARRAKFKAEPLKFGIAGYAIVRETEKEAQDELKRITDVQQSAAGYANYQQWIAGTQLEQRVSLEDYSVSNRGLRSGLVGTPEQIQERIAGFEKARRGFGAAAVQPAARRDGSVFKSRHRQKRRQPGAHR